MYDKIFWKLKITVKILVIIKCPLKGCLLSNFYKNRIGKNFQKKRKVSGKMMQTKLETTLNI